MADFGIDPTIPLGIKPVQNAPMTISDMLNIGRQAQAYGQAQALNPLQLRQQQAATKLAEETLEPSIEQKKAESEKQQIEAQKAGVDLNNHYANTARGVYGGHVTDPDFINGNSKEMVKKLEADRKYLEQIGVPTHQNAMHDQIIDLAKTNPKQAYQMIVTGLNQAAGPSSQFQQVANAQPTPVYNAPQETPQGTPQGQPQGAPQGTPSAQQNAVHLQYPVRQAGTYAPMLPSEVEDTKSGINFRNQLINRQTNLTTERRNIDEVIKTADELQHSMLPTSGILGAVTRKVATWAGDPTYIQLSKDLANTTLSNMKALGLSTDADKQLTAAANGDYTYPPEVLKNIASRAKADMTNIDMQATAAQKFAAKFGDNNMKSFQQQWSQNADSRVFEIINLGKSNMPVAEKQAKTNELLGITPNMSDKQKAQIRQEFATKYKNLQKLTQDGSL